MRKIVGTTRIRSGFLFLPKRIYGELRWLEFAKWEERLDSDFDWLRIRWISE